MPKPSGRQLLLAIILWIVVTFAVTVEILAVRRYVEWRSYRNQLRQQLVRPELLRAVPGLDLERSYAERADWFDSELDQLRGTMVEAFGVLLAGIVLLLVQNRHTKTKRSF